LLPSVSLDPKSFYLLGVVCFEYSVSIVGPLPGFRTVRRPELHNLDFPQDLPSEIEPWPSITMASTQSPPLKIDRYVVIHVATTCDEHGVYVTKDSAELIELGWILLDAHNLEEVSQPREAPH
jgi:hypothetical protein